MAVQQGVGPASGEQGTGGQQGTGSAPARCDGGEDRNGVGGGIEVGEGGVCCGVGVESLAAEGVLKKGLLGGIGG